MSSEATAGLDSIALIAFFAHEKRGSALSQHGIFCLESAEWGFANIRPTVQPVLQALSGITGRPFKYANFWTKEELRFALREWTKGSNAGFPYLYLCTHGVAKTVLVKKLINTNTTDEHLDLEWIQDNLNHAAANKVIIFGGCNIFDVHATHLKKFVKTTGLKATIGYKQTVDWLEAASLELSLLGALPSTQSINKNSLNAAMKRVSKTHKPLIAKLGLRLIF